MIYILEDNDDRVRQFREVAAAIAPEVPVRVWRNAHEMIADLTDGLEHASVISLDHEPIPLTCVKKMNYNRKVQSILVRIGT